MSLLKSTLRLLHKIRGYGSTNALLSLAYETPVVLIAGTHDNARRLSRAPMMSPKSSQYFMGLDGAVDKVEGLRKPVVFDNQAIEMLVGEGLKAERELAELKERVFTVNAFLRDMEKDVATKQNLLPDEIHQCRRLLDPNYGEEEAKAAKRFQMLAAAAKWEE